MSRDLPWTAATDPVLVDSAKAEEPITLKAAFVRHLPKTLAGWVCLAAFQYAMNRIDWNTKAAVDGMKAGVPAAVTAAVLTLLLYAGLAFATRVASRWFLFNVGRDVEFEMRTSLLGRLHELGSSFYRRMPPGEVMSRATNDLAQVRLLFGFGLLNLANVVFALASALQVLLSVSVRLTCISLLSVPVVLFFARYASRALFKLNRENQETLGQLSDRVQSNLAGVRVVRSFALEHHELSRFDDVNTNYIRASLALARLRGMLGPITGAAGAFGVLALFAYGGGMLLRGEITEGEFFAFSMAYSRMTWPLIALGFSLAIVQRGRAGFARLKDVFDAVPDVPTAGISLTPTQAQGGLSVRQLSFAHEARAILSDVSFDLRPGRSLAIVGRTGSGKSTLGQLLVRLLPTPRDAVFVGGVDVCDLAPANLRAHVAFAQQEAFLFSMTASRNIGFSSSNVQNAQIEKVTRDAQVWDEIVALPDGLETTVGERGVQLSGGQRQRVALARALLRESEILVLDDPMSAVDTETEARILRALKSKANGSTLALITHRVAAAKLCDEIIVLDEGRIIQRGTHDELARMPGLYAEFVREQQSPGTTASNTPGAH